MDKLYFSEQVLSLIDIINKDKRIFHSYLLYGDKGLGKTTFSKYIAKTILCKDKAKPCNKCISCKKIDNSSHPDLIEVLKEENNSITANEIRNLIQNINIKPNESDKKVYILKNIENLSINSSNCLLKTLEQPPKNVIFILTTNDLSNVLQTIKSRCIKIKVTPVKDHEFFEYFSAKKYLKDKDKIDKIAKIAKGNIGLAKYFLSDKKGIKAFTILNELERALSSKSSISLLQSIAPLEEKKEYIVPVFTSLSSLIERAFSDRVFLKREEALSTNNANELIKINKSALEVINNINKNVNARLALSCFVSDIIN